FVYRRLNLKAPAEQMRVIAQLRQRVRRLRQRGRRVHQLAREHPDPTLGQEAAAVGCGDEDHTRHERERVEVDRALEQRTRLRAELDVLEFLVAPLGPESVAAR